jgi:uncharacterized protein YbjT (DUF2867 family)
MTVRTGPVLVTGATGTTGGEVVRALSAAGADVAGTVRRASDAAKLPAGVRAVVADFDDPASLAAAMTGVRALYLVTPSSERAERQQLDAVDAAVAGGVEQVTLLSQLGAAAGSPVRFLHYHGVVEDRVRESGLAWTFLRPNLFFQGVAAFAGQIAHQGWFGAPIGDARVSAVDVRDIGEVAAAALLDDAHDGATYTVTGPVGLTHAGMAAALSTATGREVRFADVPPEDFAAAIDGLLPPWQAAGLLEDYAHYARGEAAAVTTAVRDVTGHEPRSFEAYARENAALFTP